MNMVAKAITKAQFTAHLQRVRTRIFALADGEQDLPFLADLAFIVGLGAEISAHVTPGAPDARRLHGALRQIVQICAAGGHWQIDQVNPLYDAAKASQALVFANPVLAQQLTPGANHLAGLIQAGTVQLDNVAGAELYQSNHQEGGTRCQ